LRIKALRNSGKELSEEEESRLPGCQWAVDSQMAHYCFFAYLSEFADNKQVSDVELAALLNVSVETIKRIEKSGLLKMRDHKSFSDMKDDGEPIVSEKDLDGYQIYR
jgi:DNA-directed RNA polymerase sigma subunit (sigma70/sigma32)